MADIELVIKVPEEDYLTFSKLSEKEKVNKLTYYEKMIAYGKPLPKKHGRLIDADKLEYIKNDRPDEIGYHYIRKYNIDYAQTIIEADKGE